MTPRALLFNRISRIRTCRVLAIVGAVALLDGTLARPSFAAPAKPASSNDDPATDEPSSQSDPSQPAGDASVPDESTAVESPTDDAVQPADAPPVDPPPAAPASEQDPNEQEAATLFREGSMFYELGQYEDAIAKFEAAWKLAPVPQLLFNIGQAHRRWYEMDPDIDHLRQAKTFFVNYDKRMQSDPSYSAREADYVQNMIEKLDAQIELEESKEAERNRVIVNGPSTAELEALEKRRIKRDKQLAVSRRMNGAGIGVIVAGSVAAAVGIGGILARTAYKVVLDNSSTGDPNTPSLATAEDDQRRRDGFLLSGQVGFGGLIAAAVFLPIGIGLRVGGGILEKRALAGSEKDPTAGEDKPATTPPPKVAFEPSASGVAVRF